MAVVAHDPQEAIAVVDARDRVVGTATRREVHERFLLHREAGVWIVTPDGRVLLQRRADNGLWAISAAGHFPSSESYVQGALREVREELGVTLHEQELREVFYGLRVSALQRCFAKTFAVMQDRPIAAFSPDSGEVAEVRYFLPEETDSLIARGLTGISAAAVRRVLSSSLGKTTSFK